MSDPGAQGTSFYSPEPHYRPFWSEHIGDPGEPGAASGTPAGPSGPMPARAGRAGSPPPLGPIIAAALLSAILGSGGTYLLLASGGQIVRPSPSPEAGATATVSPGPVRLGESSAIIDAAARVSPAIVTITSIAGFDPTSGTVPEVGVGSGVIYDPSGWILTNCHVVKGGSRLEVALLDGRTFDGTIYGIDTLTDLAIVKVDATGLPAAQTGDSTQLQPGQTVIAIGSPLGTYTNSVTSGIVSALGRSIVANGPQGCNDVLHDLIQTDAAINLGNSGGGLASTAGQVVGINTATALQAQGIGFAIPINIAKPIMAQALKRQPLARPYIGIRYVAVDPQVAAQNKLSIDFGALITPSSDGTQPGVVAGGPADQAGLRNGDVITALDGTRIDSRHPLEDLLAQHAPGDSIGLEILRGGRTLAVNVKLGTRPAGL